MLDVPGFRATLAAALLAFVSAAATADVVTMKDGRRLEGILLHDEDGVVRFDAKVSNTRATLNLPRAEIENIEKRPVPDSFFDAPPAEARRSDPKNFKDSRGVYLEVPIIGAIGKEVQAEGVSRVLAYAKRHGIPHVVFTIDSAGGSIDEAKEIYGLLRQYRESVQYHAVVRRCEGEALAVGVWCRPILLLPGGVISGLKSKAQADSDADEEDIVRSRMAERIISDTQAMGPAAGIIRALVRPGETLSAWKDESGTLQLGEEPPVNASEVILRVGKGDVLTLTREMGLALGMIRFEGSAKDVGAVLHVKEWAPESTYGGDTMTRVADDVAKKAAAKQATQDAKVKRVMSRRSDVEAHIRDSFQKAAEWDPKKETYSTYAEHYDLGYGWTGGWTSNKWTPESQRKWASRSEACMSYLLEAVKGLRAMKKLDPEAVKLGLDPLYQPGEIDRILMDLQARYTYLQKNREKTQE
ncbi:MAG TPA: hypothetical protein VFD71_11500 [Planctomycetota bacterium]|nr:hypothetical protein [Planctomycetota bacterium]